jgi:hypothetical protein
VQSIWISPQTEDKGGVKLEDAEKKSALGIAMDVGFSKSIFYSTSDSAPLKDATRQLDDLLAQKFGSDKIKALDKSINTGIATKTVDNWLPIKRQDEDYLKSIGK